MQQLVVAFGVALVVLFAGIAVGHADDKVIDTPAMDVQRGSDDEAILLSPEEKQKLFKYLDAINVGHDRLLQRAEESECRMNEHEEKLRLLKKEVERAKIKIAVINAQRVNIRENLERTIRENHELFAVKPKSLSGVLKPESRTAKWESFWRGVGYGMGLEGLPTYVVKILAYSAVVIPIVSAFFWLLSKKQTKPGQEKPATGEKI